MSGPLGSEIRLPEGIRRADSRTPTRRSPAYRPRWSRGRRLAATLLSLLVAAAIWLPSVHLLYRQDPAPYLSHQGIPPRARALAARHLHLWTDPALRAEEIRRMRSANAEWDFMGRSFLVWSLANMALRDPDRKEEHLQVMDAIIQETGRLEEQRSFYFFLMDYARARDYVQEPPRSLFVDGEIALMMGLRRLVEERPDYREPMRERVDAMVARMEAGPVLCAESYPDECWLFCNAVALAAVKVSDVLEGTDHGPFFAAWRQTAEEKLIHRETGLLPSSFTLEGQVIDGPEGSSIFLAAHCLQIVYPDLARDQFERARRELVVQPLGFAVAREWPASWPGPADVDSGLVVPGLGASPSASGFALVAAASFGDGDLLAELLASLDLAGFPIQEEGRLRYAASNQVGDAVLLYALTLGPAWDEVRRRAGS